MSRPLVGLSLMPTDDFRLAALPLFAEGLVDVLEWSVDVRYAEGHPAWFTALLDHYAAAGRLVGHGVHYSLLTARWLPHHDLWLRVAADAVSRWPVRHFSEHFGFMLAGDLDRGAPLPLPHLPGVVALGVERLERLRDAVGVPVGLENLALAFSRDDALAQGPMLAAMIEPVDGFELLDLHNLWCQATNFDIPATDLLDTHPLDRVRQIHLSGGSWTELDSGPFRRDTHDDRLPEALFPLLATALERCPSVEHVIVERMGGTLPTDASRRELGDDYRRVRGIVHG